MGAQVEGDRCTRRASGYSWDQKGFTETHNTFHTLSPPHHNFPLTEQPLYNPTRSLQILWTTPKLFCRLTMPVLLLMTSESSKDLGDLGGWGWS